MKQAKEWAEILKEHCGFGDFGCAGCLKIIEDIQNDAILNRDKDDEFVKTEDC